MTDSCEPYQAPRWLPGGHLQTLYAHFYPALPEVPYHRERWILPDGDFIDLDWVDGRVDAPLVVLFHGLEGNSSGHYATSLMDALRMRGWRGVVPNFRGCSGEANRLPRAYHSGDSAEIEMILRRLRQENGRAPLLAIGISLGGNALLKWLGESGPKALDFVDAAAAISAPLDLTVSGRTLDAGLNRLTYTRHFLRTLKPKALNKIATHRLPLNPRDVRAAKTLYAFDELYTAPIHGFRSADDYWQRASSKPWLNSISVPTLIINAKNDPFLPASALPTPEEVSQVVTLDFPAEGGHVGFVTGPFPGNLSWLPKRTLGFFDDCLALSQVAHDSQKRHNSAAYCTAD
jgi:predicted alpha/beta-fold hydrolase